MPDPRAVSTHRLGTLPSRPLTFKGDGVDIVFDANQPNGSAVVGRAVMMSGNGIVRLCGDGDRVLGKLIKVEPDGYCHVLCNGVADLPKGDGAIAVGARIVGNLTGAARGYIRSVAAAPGTYAAATADEIGRGAHVVLDASVTSAVEVLLHN